jgi:dipeptidyl aminopeptidase/acylaminoacyl peptidase
VFTATDPMMLTELYVFDGDKERRLTSFGSSFSADRPLSAPERFTATSTGGSEVEAWVMRPSDFVPGIRYPTLVNIHGGPFSQYGNKFFDEFQLQAAAGYVVVYCNPRGSSGYTEAWGRAIRWPECDVDPGGGWGSVDYDDIMAVVDESIARFDFIDSDRMGVLGGSYGGYMTSWIISRNDRFKAACSERAVNDLLNLEHDSDIASMFADYVGVGHIDDAEPYRRQSPITHVKSINTPVLIIHSESDLRCPISQGESLFVALRLQRRPVEFVRFPGEGHELSRSGSPSHRVQRAEIILDWFDRHLKAAI